MGLEAYARMCKALAQELLTALGENEIHELRNFFSNITRGEWMKWRAEHHSEVMAYVSSTPSQRKRRKTWNDPGSKGLFVLAAYHHCLEAHAVLDMISNGEFHTGCSYRDMAAYAGDCYRRILIRLIPTWPFKGPSPF